MTSEAQHDPDASGEDESDFRPDPGAAADDDAAFVAAFDGAPVVGSGEPESPSQRDTAVTVQPEAPVPVEDAPVATPPITVEPAAPDLVATGARRTRGVLPDLVAEVANAFVTGEPYHGESVPSDTVLTPSRISKIIDTESPPSAGAITNVLKYWREIGYAVIEDGPLRFVDYTNAARTVGLAECKARHKAAQAAAAAEQPAEQPAEQVVQISAADVGSADDAA